MPNNNNRRNNSNNRDNDNGGNGGGGGGGTDCGICRPCGVCELSNKCGTFICAIICTVWGAILTLISVSYLITSFSLITDVNDNASSYGIFVLVSYLVAFFISLFFLVASILLICASRKNGKEKKCWVFLWIWAALILVGVSLICLIAFQVWYCGSAFYGYGTYFNMYYLGFGCIIWLWYPWWIAYAYWCDLGGKSWCNCQNC